MGKSHKSMKKPKKKVEIKMSAKAPLIQQMPYKGK
jgi:hypothetical protein